MNRNAPFNYQGMDEKQLCREFVRMIGADFVIRNEVEGQHLITGEKVRADFVLFPRQHLIEAGFDAEMIVVEIKSAVELFEIQRASKVIVQALSYQQSKFMARNPHEYSQPNFTLIFPPMQSILGEDSASIFIAETIMLHLGLGTIMPMHKGGWRIRFAGVNYFSRYPNEYTNRFDLLKRHNPKWTPLMKVGSI